MLSLIELDKPHIDLELYGTDTNIAPIDKVHIMDEDSLFRLSERNQELLTQMKENPNVNIAVEIEEVMAETS